MKNLKKPIVYVLTWLALGAVSSLVCNAYSQLQVAQSKKKITGSDVIACFSDRPCILWLRQSGKSLQIGWDGQGNYDSYNLRWSQEGKKTQQVDLQGGGGGSYKIENLSPCLSYSLKVRGCRILAVNSVRCSHWGAAMFSLKPHIPFEMNSCE